MTAIAARVGLEVPVADDDVANTSGHKLIRRQKVTAACDECRRRKIKCNGLRPVCTPCGVRRGSSVACNWGFRKGRGNVVPVEDLIRLQRRIDKLEGERGHATASRHQTATPTSVSDVPCHADNTIHANAMMGLMEDGDHFFTHRYDDSSATSFMEQIKGVIDQHITPLDPPASPSVSKSAAEQTTRNPPNEQCPALDYVLPPRRKADHLLQVYWELSGTLYPFLDQEEVGLWYSSLWTGENLSADGPLMLCLLNTMLSIASLLDTATKAEDRVNAADTFYQRAKALLNFEMIQQRSVLTVQCFLLLGQYLQSTNKPQQCWLYIGLAIRIAQSLGLDLPSQNTEPQSAYQQELRRKVWHGCVLMDRTLSMIFGRPAMITSQAATSVSSPAAHAVGSDCDCFAEPYGTGTGTSTSDFHFFVEALKLYELMSETVLTLYDPTPGSRADDDVYVRYFGILGAKALGNVLGMDKKLFQWSRGLPPHLQYRSGHHKTAIHQRQANILWLKHRHIRILLYRPVLSWFCSNHEAFRGSLEEALPWKMALQCSLSCVQTAFETVGFFDSWLETSRLEELDDYLPAWWYSIFYIYSAATVLVAAQTQPSIVAELSQKRITDAWHKALKALRRFRNFTSHAERCVASVSLLYEKVPQQHQQYRDQQQQQLLHGQHHGLVQNDQQQEPGPNYDGLAHLPSQHHALASGDALPPFNTAGAAAWPNGPIADFVGAHGSPLNQALLGTVANGSATDFSYPDYLNISNIHYDLENMSWLSSVPLQLYSG